jgi:selenide,water dikinase
METQVRLTSFSHGAGCGCKLSPDELTQVLRALPPVTDPNVLVGAVGRDDAAVYRLGAEQAVVSTLDFFTPIVDNPDEFGAIAATNAISDIYAMGATPLYALCITAFPRAQLGTDLLDRMVAGGAAKLAEAGVPVIGGHSIDDAEPKLGYAVTGVAHPDRIVTNRGARAGDVLFLTKPLGSGLVATAIKRGVCPPDVERAAVAVMTHLNRAASAAMVAAGAHAATDVTGFGLAGHLLELGVGAEISFAAVPQLDGVADLAVEDLFPSGTRRNHAAAAGLVEWGALTPTQQLLMCDAQTSGGLLVALAPDRAGEFEGALAAEPYPAIRIGSVVDGPVRFSA